MGNAAVLPRVSILIPCYNAERYIGATLDSVFAQTWASLEVIVVDDGSVDGSAGIVEGYTRRGAVLVRQKTLRAGAARNRAFHAASGQFILYLDADDLISPDHVASLVSAISHETDAVGMSPWARFRDDWREAVFSPRPTYRDMDGPSWLVLDWADAEPMTQCGAFLIPRALIERFGGWLPELSFGPCDDFEFFARIIARSRTIRFAAGGGLYYRSGMSGSLSGTKNRRAMEMKLESLLLGTRHLLAVEDSPRTRQACANILMSFEYNHYPAHGDLRAKARARVAELGGTDLVPDGPPGFHTVRRFLGWRAARRAQRISERLRLNDAFRGASRR